MLRNTHHGKACPYCNRAMDRADRSLQPTRDHVIPVCHGGTKKIICCLTCNGMKADMLPEAWSLFMAAHPGWWLLSRIELRAIRRKERGLAPRVRHPRRLRYLQGTAPAAPVVVPATLIYNAAQPGG